MRGLRVLTLVAGLNLLVGACASAVNMQDPDIAVCNTGGPLSKSQMATATEPNPQAVSGRPVDCIMINGVMRLPPGKRISDIAPAR